MTTRRDFFSALLGGTMVLDHERLLWRPGAKFISIPNTFGSTYTWSHLSNGTRVMFTLDGIVWTPLEPILSLTVPNVYAAAGFTRTMSAHLHRT